MFEFKEKTQKEILEECVELFKSISKSEIVGTSCLQLLEVVAEVAFYDQNRLMDFYGIERKSSCGHEWQKYEGFTETYTYCKHCDQRKAI